jgi:hypothetical protein
VGLQESPLAKVSSERPFPPPWSVEETDACAIVRDANVMDNLRFRRRCRIQSTTRSSGSAPAVDGACWLAKPSAGQLLQRAIQGEKGDPG